MANGTIAFDTLTTSDSKGTANLSANVERSIDTTYILHGVCKQWTSFNQETPEVFNSFNLSSMTDRTTGKTQHNFTSVMTGQKLYAVSGMTLDEGESQAVMDGCDNDFTDALKYEVNTMDTTNAARDCDHGYTMVQGELA